VSSLAHRTFIQPIKQRLVVEVGDAVAIKVTFSTKGGGLAARRNRSVIVVYAFSTPNSVRVPIALEELGLDYELKPVNVKKRNKNLPIFGAESER